MDPVPSSERPAADVVRFHRLWDAHAVRVRAYARRVAGPDVADDVLSDTFLVAWRRLDEVPEDAFPWLLVVAKNSAANGRRSAGRQSAVQSEMARLHHLIGVVPGVDEGVAERLELLVALHRLTPLEREALLLTAWDGLSARQAARVAGCSSSAMHVRLFRARRRLREASPDGAARAAPDAGSPPAPQTATTTRPVTPVGALDEA